MNCLVMSSNTLNLIKQSKSVSKVSNFSFGTEIYIDEDLSVNDVRVIPGSYIETYMKYIANKSKVS
jgi:RNase adaptor protein for sRNA GlmZ degradation